MGQQRPAPRRRLLASHTCSSIRFGTFGSAPRTALVLQLCETRRLSHFVRQSCGKASGSPWQRQALGDLDLRFLDNQSSYHTKSHRQRLGNAVNFSQAGNLGIKQFSQRAEPDESPRNLRPPCLCSEKDLVARSQLHPKPATPAQNLQRSKIQTGRPTDSHAAS